MAKKSKSAVNKINVRMYRVGTGDFFLLQFKKTDKVTFNLMIDCGCIHGGKADFADKVEDLSTTTNGVIDLLIVTHEHADHINGFEKTVDIFDTRINVKKVWFAWTEADETFANDFRKEHTKVKMAVKLATEKLNKLRKDQAFDKVYEMDHNQKLLINATNHFIASLNALTELNYEPRLSLDKIPTMEDILKKFKVIKADTVVEFREPGEVIENITGAEGIRFFVLGPPKSNEDIKKEEVTGEGYEKREKKSTLDMAFLNLFDSDHFTKRDLMPFDETYALEEKVKSAVKDAYKAQPWRTIDNDWLFSAGNLALRHETSINNTSLVIAIQFKKSERILLLPGDAEHGNWLSWHKNLEWTIKDKNKKTKKVNAEYILNNTVFYKVGHHLSHNGTAKQKGLEMMKQDDLAAMATLDFKKINSVWLNTMPNDLIGEELIRKTKGKLFFLGDYKKILKNINTSRVTISKANMNRLEKLNEPFDGQISIEYEVTG
jgi:hypothetical protein